MKGLLLTILVSSFIQLTKAQTLSKSYVDAWIRTVLPQVEIDNKTVYVLNGLLAERDSLSSKLSKYTVQDLVFINHFDWKTTEKLILCNPASGIIVLQTAGNQSRTSIREFYKNASRKYRNSSSETGAGLVKKGLVLILDGKAITQDHACKVLRDIKLNTVAGINFIDRPVSAALYGRNAAYGVLIITTYSKSQTASKQ